MFGQSFLRECIDYDSDTGVITWRKRPREHFATLNANMAWNARYSGTEAGGLDNKGYRRIAIARRWHKAHRLIWEWMTGEVPVEVDHINRNPSDNRWSNLRNVNHAGNQRNRKLNANSSTGVPGVYVDKRTGRFQAMISIDGRNTRLGSFETLEDAKSARRAAERCSRAAERTQETNQTASAALSLTA